MAKDLQFDTDARAKLQTGVDTLAKAVAATLGPRGRNIVIEKGFLAPQVTKDGVTVAKSIELPDPVENIGARLIREVASKTEGTCGDGPQPLYSGVLTPTGFVRMGDVKVGMKVCGTDSTVQEVTGVFPKGKREVYEVRLTDGRVVECCEDHLWSVTTNYGKEKTLTVRELLDSGQICVEQKDGSSNHGFFVRNNTVEFDEQTGEMLLDPYFLGVLLGDGSMTGTGSVELSLGVKKKGILDTLKLPEGISMGVSNHPEKSYVRAKFSGHGILRDALRQLGLFGTNSHTKFIPDAYLYSGVSARKELLRGLLDTDGYINSHGRFEFSTVSPKLASDFSGLCHGLGIALHHRVHYRDNDTDSYSDTPIYRFAQLKGYKYGYAVDSIERLGRTEEMQCIKVSNKDNLYVTDGYVVTHNTTTATVLAQAIVESGLKSLAAGANPVALKRGIEMATEDVVKNLKETSRPVEGDEIEKVAGVSANDLAIGKIIAATMEKVGGNGVVTVEDSPTIGMESEVVDGMRLEQGYISPYFVTSEKMTAELKDVRVIVTDGQVSNQHDLMKPLESLMADGVKSIVIVADSVEGEALATLVVNKMRGSLNVCAVKAPWFGDRKKELLKDLAAVTGGQLLSQENGAPLKEATAEMIGGCRTVTVTRDHATFVDGRGSTDAVEERVRLVKAELENSDSDVEKEYLKKRLAKLAGGVGVIKVGAATDVETKEVRQRVEDALNATTAAIEEGIVPGGGVALMRAAKIPVPPKPSWLHVDEKVGYDILLQSLLKPVMKIAENAGLDGQVAVMRIGDAAEDSVGLNAMTGKYEDMYKAGIIDPTKVVRLALQNAASIASLVLMTEAVVTDIPEEKGEGVPPLNV